MSKSAGPDLARMERMVSTVLRAGLALGMILIVIGVLLLAYTGQTGYGAIPPHGLSALIRFTAPGGPGHFPTAPNHVVREALAGKPYAIIGLGLLVFIATPALRVTLSVGFFAVARDRSYVVLTLLVLAVLVTSYLLGASAG